MNKQLTTIKVSGGDYAKVPVRLKQFREDCPNGEVTSKRHWNEDGSLDFETTIVKDLRKPDSARSTGWAHYSKEELENPKAFEKLQTISVGRALSNLGYFNNGEIAGTEEMEEFHAYRDSKVAEAVSSLESSKSIEGLREVFTSLGTLISEKGVIEAKDRMKAKLQIMEEQSENSKTTAK